MSVIAAEQTKETYKIEQIAVADLPEKASQRQLCIRRAIEDRNEKKRLEELETDTYWDSLD